MSCDLVVADRSARFAMTPANIGLPYTTSGLLRFFNNLPIHLLKEMFFCAQSLDAEWAERFGMVNRLVGRDNLEATSLELARGIAGKAPLAIQAIKEQLRILEDLQPMSVQAMEQIAELRRRSCESADFSEGWKPLPRDGRQHSAARERCVLTQPRGLKRAKSFAGLHMNHRTRRPFILCATALICSAALGAAPPAGGASSAASLFGFTAEESARQQSLEQRFDSELNPADLSAWMKNLSSQANHVGSPHDKANAEFVREQLKQWGWDAQIEMFYPLYPTLKQHTLELLAPTRFVAALKEPAIPGDATSTRTDAIAPYNVYGADGDITGDLVYLNYGMPDDYKDLARRGVDVKGKIVITRYGVGWRGLKPKLAQEHGAIGCIIYSDPQDDGYAQGDVYPKGGWRPADGVQRGSVADLTLYSGDPLTPGVGATKDAKRLPLSQAKALLKIPVMPISYADAQPLLVALGGPVAPANWRGALPITYHIGPGPAKVHLAISSNWDQTPIYDVIAKIPGSQSPDEWVVRGNHRDGWVFGAWDPLSGHVALLAEAKAIGALLKTGWRPKRTLVYASWDGEEAGLLGSTEWAETHADELRRKAVLYVNTDTNSRGFLLAGGSHTLQRLVNDVAAGVMDPETSVSTEARLRARLLVDGYERGASEREKKIAKVAAGGDLPIAALGSGSDFTPFLQHLGITAVHLAYEGEDEQGGVFHSSYDSFDHYLRFGDPGFVYGIAEAKTVGHVVLRMADAGVLPLQFAGFADTVDGYVSELHGLADQKRKAAEELGKLLDENAFALAGDPTRPVAAPERDPEVPYLDFAPLDNVVARLKKSAKAYDDGYAKLEAGSSKLTVTQSKKLNGLLRGMEGTLMDPRGLPGRDWYKHLIYAPGLYTGYGVKTIPGVREAIEQNQWDLANQYTTITAAVLTTYCERLEQATALLG
jgi:N-acetylated-alpha-linked acidic dipeptidase